MPKSAEKFLNPWEKFPLLGDPTLLALRIRLPTPYYSQLEMLRIEKSIQNNALGTFAGKTLKTR